MTLTGISPSDPTPADRRELILGASEGGTGMLERTVLIYGNRTSSGSETVDVLDATSPIQDDDDAIARFGRRSEWRAMYRKYVAVDPNATIYGIAVTESGGTAAACDFVVATVADATATGEFTIHGETVHVDVAEDDALATIIENIKVAINGADGSSLQVTADHDSVDTVTITCAQAGPRGDHIIGADATHGIRFRWLGTTGISTTVTKGNVVNGTTADDGSAAFASAVNYENYYWVLPWHATAGPTATDNQIGEAILNITQQALPANGKDQIAIIGLRKTQANATTVATDSDCNSVYAHFFHAEENDWTPAMLAAHYAAVKRSQEVAHPAANFAGYPKRSSDVWMVPPPYLVANRATSTEIRADLNNGVSPLGTTAGGGTYIVRDVTSYSETAADVKDYRARGGHLFSATAFAWQLFRSRYAAQKQAFVDEDPAEGQMPAGMTTTPIIVRGIMEKVIDDLTAPKPKVGGAIYDGPILKPSAAGTMKASIVCEKIAAGISISAKLQASEHNYKSETKLYEVSDPY